jgi:4'-phosphopantetheinyl transferase
VSVVKPLSVCWDGDAGGLLLAEPRGLALLGVRGQSARDEARLRIRTALTAALAAYFGIDAGRIALHSPQGVAPWAMVALDAGDQRVALSISHDGDLSVAAYCLSGVVGIDVMSILPVPDWEPVARDYLGPEAARKLAARSDGERDAAFAHAWSEHEARLKCLGLQLAGWCDERAAGLPLLSAGAAGRLCGLCCAAGNIICVMAICREPADLTYTTKPSLKMGKFMATKRPPMSTLRVTMINGSISDSAAATAATATATASSTSSTKKSTTLPSMASSFSRCARQNQRVGPSQSPCLNVNLTPLLGPHCCVAVTSLLCDPIAMRLF